jgi:hypothetical protein
LLNLGWVGILFPEVFAIEISKRDAARAVQGVPTPAFSVVVTLGPRAAFASPFALPDWRIPW